MWLDKIAYGHKHEQRCFFSTSQILGYRKNRTVTVRGYTILKKKGIWISNPQGFKHPPT